LGYGKSEDVLLALFDADALKHYAKVMSIQSSFKLFVLTNGILKDGKQLVARKDGRSFLDDEDEAAVESNSELNPYFEVHFLTIMIRRLYNKSVCFD